MSGLGLYGLYLEGQGDLVSTLIMGIIRVTIWVMWHGPLGIM